MSDMQRTFCLPQVHILLLWRDAAWILGPP